MPTETALVRRRDWIRWLRVTAREAQLPPHPLVIEADRPPGRRMGVISPGRLVAAFIRGRFEGALERLARKMRRP